jgi:hypothetical protein
LIGQKKDFSRKKVFLSFITFFAHDTAIFAAYKTLLSGAGASSIFDLALPSFVCALLLP